MHVWWDGSDTVRHTTSATVVHKKGDFSHVVKMPLSSLSLRVRSRVAQLPTTTSRTYRFKSGDQCAESTFAVIKRNLARLNLKSSGPTASLNFLSAAWLGKNPGLEGVVRALQIYRENLCNVIAPQDAFVSTLWLDQMESTD